MKDFNFADYTGKGVRVVLLDCGILEDVPSINYDGTSINDIKEEIKLDNAHAKACIDAAKISAPNGEYIVINVGEVNTNIINEENVILGMEQAIALMPKVIITSFSFEYISEKMQSIFMKAIDIGIIVCSSVDQIIRKSYPQNIDKVISVNELKDDKIDQKIIFDNGIFYIKPSIYLDITGNGSSFANAYFAGVIAAISEFCPLVTSESIMEFYKYAKEENLSVSNSNAYYLISGLHEVTELSNLISKNYRYYYDDVSKKFKDIMNNKAVSDSQITEVDVVCGDDFMIKLPNQIKDFKQRNISWNSFDNFSTSFNYLQEEITSLMPISVPSICICSYGMNMEKFHLQLEMNKFLDSLNYNVGNISFNPIVKLLGYNYLSYPKSIAYPQYVYSLNNQLYETSESKDILISSIAGDFDRFINFEHRLGELSNLFFMAHNPDVIILSISEFVSISELKKVKRFVENVIGAKLIFYVSKRNRDDNYYGPSDYNILLSNEDVENYCKQVSADTKIKTFSNPSIIDRSLFKYLLELFT